MTRIKSLSAGKLRTSFPPERIQWENSTLIPRNGHRNHDKLTAQPRAMQALDLALHIKASDYHVYLSGEPELGRTYMLKDFLSVRTRKTVTPADLIYVNNFEDADKPLLIAIPAGQGRKLKANLAQALGQIRKELPSRFETNAYVKKRSGILDRFQTERAGLLHKMDAVAEDQGFNLDVDDQGGLTLYPLVEGKRLSEEEFEKLDAQLRQSLKRKGDTLLRDMTGLMRQLSRAEQDFRAEERTLEREVMTAVLDAVLTPYTEKALRACQSETLKHFFEALRTDILDNPEGFLPKEPVGASQTQEPLPAIHQEYDSYRYDINLFVDNSKTQGAPIIVDDHPTPSNLLGCVEREAEMGALITDFTLIKSGSLHRANGGFLVLHIEDILQHPNAWEGLIRALRSGFARIEDAGDPDTIKTKGIEPEPLVLSLKVILVGTEEMYETLLVHDDRFPKLFKIKAHMTEFMERNADGVRIYMLRLARIIDEAQLLPFTNDAMAGLVDYGSLLCEDQRKLSLRFPLLREIMLEASAFASLKGAELVDATTLVEAQEARKYRANLVEEIYMEEYDRELIKVRTSGTQIGRVNGLSVTWYGNFEFGLPHQISCTVGVGHGGIIDLEREAELGGPIHTKAMMILKSYLVDQFAHNKPLVMTGSLCFEQSYAGIEGDSASGAELAALLSAIAEVPVCLSLAFTGAVSQSGQIMAVGGVTRKIEGFFEVCKRRGLTGTQGVIIPADNVPHLMLSPEVVNAVRQEKFAIYPVSHITEALSLLVDIPIGNRRKDGTFTPNSLYSKVDKRLALMGHLAENAFSKRKR